LLIHGEKYRCKSPGKFTLSIARVIRWKGGGRRLRGAEWSGGSNDNGKLWLLLIKTSREDSESIAGERAAVSGIERRLDIEKNE